MPFVFVFSQFVVILLPVFSADVCDVAVNDVGAMVVLLLLLC